jgi:Mrp family chromosome partitioning ATPase
MYSRIAMGLATAGPDRPAKSILVTSARDSEGKSTSSVNLACSLAQAGYRVILVDGDMRKGTLHKILEVNRNPGLSHILQGELSAQERLAEELAQQGVPQQPGTWRIEDYLQPTRVENMWVMASGTTPSNSVKCLNSPHARSIFDQLKERADFIIVDSPPVLSVVDPCLLAQLCDSTILVVGEGMITKSDGMHVKRALRNAAERIRGAVLNKSQDRFGEGYYYYYYSYK